MAEQWRVIAIGQNGNRVVLDRDITHEQALECRTMLESTGLFLRLYVERDEPAASANQRLSA